MSGQILHLEPDPHAAVQRLLPWYLTGRLETAEHDVVEAHLAQCPECRVELETERQWQLLQPGHGAHVDVEDGWARMRARLGGDTLPTPMAASRRRAWSLPGWHADGRLQRRAWAVPGALSVALALALVVTLRPAPLVGEYRTLGTAAEAGATAAVRFKPDATEAQIRQGLKDSGARLVDGPTATDAYVVRLPREHYAAALDKLRKQPGVVLVVALDSAAP
jgi:anti-sigma factor RsiW